jgi:hypothetical protein
MIGNDYLSRQAATLLKMARITKDQRIAVGLAEKAADLTSRMDEAPPAPTSEQKSG